MKVLAIVSSRERESNTLALVNRLYEKFSNRKNDIEWAVLTPDKYRLDFSPEPRTPFIEGVDIVEENDRDDTSKIKILMKQADVIILGTPTYFANVSADMKLIIDRFCYLAHLFYFAKKPCITVVTSDGAGHVQASNYLKTFCEGLGMIRTGEIMKQRNSGLSDDTLELIIDNTLEVLKNKTAIKPTITMEMAFSHWKRQISNQPKNFSEYKYWTENGLMKCETLEEYFLKCGG